jgi:putative aminopeptidase FrvX
MTAANWKLLEELCAIHAVSGREDAMTAFVRERIKTLVDEWHVDNLGNVVGILKGTKEPETRLMLQAHMDELGLIVRNITDDGFLLIERIGGVPEKSLLGQRVDVLTDAGSVVPGYVGTKSHHITSPTEKFVVPNVHQMYIDLGLPSRAAVAAAGVQIGDPITYHPNFHRFGEKLVCSKALDNRVSVYALLQVLEALVKKRPDCSVVFSFTVLEEFSIRGSLPTVNFAKPEAIISIDITIATDTPSERTLQAVAMGQGPAIKMMDFHGRGTLGGMFSSPKLRRFIEGLAKANEIPLQREAIVGMITDPAFQLYLGEKGYTIAALSIPQRYTHASISTCHEDDIEQTIALLEACARNFSAQVDLSRG